MRTRGRWGVLRSFRTSSWRSRRPPLTGSASRSLGVSVSPVEGPREQLSGNSLPLCVQGSRNLCSSQSHCRSNQPLSRMVTHCQAVLLLRLSIMLVLAGQSLAGALAESETPEIVEKIAVISPRHGCVSGKDSVPELNIASTLRKQECSSQSSQMISSEPFCFRWAAPACVAVVLATERASFPPEESLRQQLLSSLSTQYYFQSRRSAYGLLNTASCRVFSLHSSLLCPRSQGRRRTCPWRPSGSTSSRR